MSDLACFPVATSIASQRNGVSPRRAEIAVIDTSLPDWRVLRDGVNAGTEVVLIGGGGDGLAELAGMLGGRRGIDAIHVLSHGFAGGFMLGAARLDATTLESYVPALTTIGASLSDDAAVLIYGCHTASGQGPAFLSALSAIIGAPVAASYNLTGYAASGADWKLGYRSGAVASGVALTDAAMRGYRHTLTLSTLTVTTLNPYFVRGAAGASTTGFNLFSGADANTNALFVNFTGAVFDVYNLSGGGESLDIGGTDVALVDGTTGSLSSGGIYAVSVTAGVATVTLSGMNLNNANMNTLLDGITYRSSSDPGSNQGVDEDRSIVLQSVTDSGNASTNTLEVNRAATVTINDGSTANYFGTSTPVTANVTLVPGTPLTVQFDNVLSATALVGSVSALTAVLPAGWTIDNATSSYGGTNGNTVDYTGIIGNGTDIYQFDITSTGTNTSGVFPVSFISTATGINLTNEVASSTVMVDIVPSPPVFVSMSAVTGQNTIVLTYNEALDATNLPPLAQFEYGSSGAHTVGINGSAYDLSGVSASGNTIILTVDPTAFSGGFSPGDIIDLQYIDPTAGDDALAIQSVTGADAASITYPSYVVNYTAPSLTATGLTSVFAQGGTLDVPLFSGANANTNDTGQTITSFTVTVTNVTDTIEFLGGVPGGLGMALINGANGSFGDPTAGGGTYTVSGAGTTKTLTATGLSYTAAQFDTVLDDLAYFNSAPSVTTGPRVVTVTSITDSGANNNVDVPSGVVGTVNVDLTAPVVYNDPTLTATGDTATFVQGSTIGVNLFGAANASANDVGQTITGFTLTVTNVTDSLEFIGGWGNGVALSNGASGPVGLAVYGQGGGSVSGTGTTKTLTVTGLTYTASEFDTLIDDLQYFNSDANVTPAQRVVTLTQITDSGASQNVGVLSGIVGTVDVSATPAAPAITSAALTDSTLPVISGTAVDNSTVTVTVGGATYTTVATGGNWSIDLSTASPTAGALVLNPNGPNTVNATETVASVVSAAATQTLTIDTTAPAAPVITSPDLTDIQGSTLTGTAEAGSTVTVTVGDATYTTVATGGNWSIDLSTASPTAGVLALNDNGPNPVTATATDPAGNVSTAATETLTIDTTAPAAPVITSPDLTNSVTPVLTGTAESGDTVTLTIGGATYTVVATGGAWSIDLATATPAIGTLVLDPNGVNAVDAFATDPAGNQSNLPPGQQLLTIDTTPPAPPAITSPDVTDSLTPVIGGTAEAGSTVTVTVGGATYTTTATGGAWSIDLSTAVAVTGVLALLDNAPNAVSATATDPAGNVSTAATETLTTDTIAPAAPVITTPDVTNSLTPVIGGTAEAGSTVTVTVGGATYTTTATGGAWSIDLSDATPVSGTLALLENADNAVNATATDPAGNVSTAATETLTTDTIAPPSPVITSPTVTNNPLPVLSGTAEAGDTVTVSVAGALYTTIATGGVWSIDLATADPVAGTLALDDNGPNSVGAFATDPAGNGSPPPPAAETLTIYTTPPAAPVITSPALTDSLTPVIGGTADVGSTVTVVVAGATYTVVATDGVWSIDLSTATPDSGTLALLDNAGNAVSVTATDPAGNVSTPATETLTTDTTAPAAPVITSPALTDSVAPVIGGTAEAGSTVTVTVGGATYTTVATAGAWSIDLSTASPTAGVLALNDNGPNPVSATATDPAGNVSTAATETLTVDTTAPVTPVITSPALTDSLTPVIGGTAEAGDTVTLSIGGASYTAIATGGVWSINLATATPNTGTLVLNPNGENPVNAYATDPAGNESNLPPAQQTLTVDTTAPAVPVITSPDLTNSMTPMIAGSADAGSIVTVVVAGASYTVVATEGGWSINLATATPVSGTLALNYNGANPVSATATDPAGNVSAPAAATLTIDTTPPVPPTLGESVTTTNPAAPVIDGTAESGSTVVLYQNGTPIDTTTATAGAWSFDYASTLAAGSYALTATATDAAGNVSALSAPLTLQVNADNSYAVVTPVANTDTTKSFIYASTGVLSTVQTDGAQNQLLTSVTDTAAVINIYDTAGTLIGTITQPSTSAFSQPVFSTTPSTLAASTGSGPIGSVVNLLSETNNFVSQGNDDITVHSGTAVITATGPSTVVNNVSANLTFYGGSGTATVNGGSGSVIAVGGAGGGTLTGGTAGHNVLAAGGGITTVNGVANGDMLFGANGTDTLVAGAGVETLVAGAGTETLDANTGDAAFGGSGNSTLNGGPNGGSTLVGGSGTNMLIAGSGAENLWAGSGKSTLQGGAGSDIMGGSTNINSTTLMIGGTGNATFLGSAGTTTATGGSGNDTYWTGTGAMTITEGSGSDTVVFGSGTANVTGGTGTDFYTFLNGHAGGLDMISNFKVGQDQLKLFGYNMTAVQPSVVGGNTVLSLSDGTSITLLGVTHLTAQSIVG